MASSKLGTPTPTEPVEGEILEPINPGVPTERQINQTLDKVDGAVAKKKQAQIEISASSILERQTIVRFNKKWLTYTQDPYPHYRTLNKDYFNDIAYSIMGGVPRSLVGDVYEFLKSRAEDLTPYSNYILFGLTTVDSITRPELTDYDAFFAEKHKQLIWDMKELAWLHSEDASKAVWRSPYPRVQVKVKVDDVETSDIDESPIPFIMSLAGKDPGVYDDIMQSLAPIVMDKKPDGVVWWVGSGANGKSTLMDALYRIFPGQLASMNVKRLTDGRDTPALNARLANIVKESSEGRVDDTEIYKALGTHENFRVHRFHSQEEEEIDGNIHSIFSANSIPTFNDKGYSARRRTFIIPFTQQFESDPDFERKTFTADFFGKLVNEMTRYAVRLKEQGYRYKWSAKTRNAKETYDKEANNAEEYSEVILQQGVVAFTDYRQLRNDYENWCAENGYVALGLGNLRKSMNAIGFERSTTRNNAGVDNIYKLPDVGTVGLELLGLGRPGLFTTTGFQPKSKPTVPEFDGEPKSNPVLQGKW